MDTLKTKKEFDFVYKNGFCRYHKTFTLYVCKEQAQKGSFDTFHRANQTLLGLSVSRKVGNAVTRNLIKRRVRMLCRENQQIAFGYRIVFVAKAGVADLAFTDFKEAFDNALAYIVAHQRNTKKSHIKQSKLQQQAQKRHTTQGHNQKNQCSAKSQLSPLYIACACDMDTDSVLQEGGDMSIKVRARA